MQTSPIPSTPSAPQVPNGATGGWIDAASRVIVQVGFPTVVAGVLLWFLLTKFTDNMNDIAHRMEANAKAVEMFTVLQDNQLVEMKEHTKELRSQTQMMKEWVAAKKRGELP